MSEAVETNDDREMQAWREQWQQLGARDDLARELASRAKRDGRRMRRAALGEVLATALSSSFCAWMLVRSRGAATVVAVTALVLLFNGAWLAQFFGARAGLFRASGDTVGAYAQLARARLDAEARWVRTAKRWTAALALALLPWAGWVAYAQRAVYAAEPWRAAVGFGGAALILAGVAWQLRRRSLRLDLERQALEQQVFDANGGPEA